MKLRKAVGRVGIQNEVWVFGQEQIAEEMKEVLNVICKKGYRRNGRQGQSNLYSRMERSMTRGTT